MFFFQEEEQSYKYAFRVVLKDANLLREINSIQREVRSGNVGFEMYCNSVKRVKVLQKLES